MGAGTNLLGGTVLLLGGALAGVYYMASNPDKAEQLSHITGNTLRAGANAVSTPPPVAADQLNGNGKISILYGVHRPLDHAEYAQQSALGSIFTFRAERVERRGPDGNRVAGYSRHPDVTGCDSLINVNGVTQTVATTLRQFNPNYGCQNLD